MALEKDAGADAESPRHGGDCFDNPKEKRLQTASGGPGWNTVQSRKRIMDQFRGGWKPRKVLRSTTTVLGQWQTYETRGVVF